MNVLHEPKGTMVEGVEARGNLAGTAKKSLTAINNTFEDAGVTSPARKKEIKDLLHAWMIHDEEHDKCTTAVTIVRVRHSVSHEIRTLSLPVCVCVCMRV